MGWRGYNYQRRRGKAALDAATTTEKERMAGTGAWVRLRVPGRRRHEMPPLRTEKKRMGRG